MDSSLFLPDIAMCLCTSCSPVQTRKCLPPGLLPAACPSHHKPHTSCALHITCSAHHMFCPSHVLHISCPEHPVPCTSHVLHIACPAYHIPCTTPASKTERVSKHRERELSFLCLSYPDPYEETKPLVFYLLLLL